MRVLAPGAWETEEDDFGEPMVFHRHRDGNVTAYLTDTPDGIRIATCAECHEEIELRQQAPPDDPEDQLFTRSRIPSSERQGPTSVA